MTPKSSSEFTIATLKEYLLAEIKRVEEKSDAADKLLTQHQVFVAESLKKDSAEYERRLTGLNHEAVRINEAAANSVNREVFGGFVAGLDEWKRRTEATLATAVPQTEFRAYKDSTSTALTLQAGSREGVRLSASTIVSGIFAIGGILAIIAWISTFEANRPASTPAPVIYVTPTLPSPTTTTTTRP